MGARWTDLVDPTEAELLAVEPLLDPDAIAQSYLHLIDQPRSSWSWEIEVRPWLEKF